ncbi:MAG: flagellar hook-associated protein FlgK, partial [Planctomycetota bacterium]
MTTSSLIIGKTALQASQLALQVTGNNIANATTPGYSRQRAEQVVTASQEVQRGVFVGRGVGVQEVRRLVDEALQTRVRSATSDEMAASVSASIMDSIESITNELSGNDISTRLEEFFNAFSELANNPAQSVTRAAVLETTGRLTGQIQAIRSDFVELRDQVDADIRATVEEVNGLLSRIAKLNDQIVDSEAGAGENPGLRDQRDALLDELSQQIDIAVIPQDTGAVRVLVGSEPLVEGERYRELRVNEQFNPTTEMIEFEVRTVDDGTTIFPSGGRLGALIDERANSVQRNIDELDTFAAQLIFEVNRLHSQGRPDIGLTSASSSLGVPAADQILALNDPANLTFSNLPMQANNGSFPVVVTDSNGNRDVTIVDIDLDGILAGGGAGFTD